MMRSRVTLAMIEAAAIESEPGIALDDGLTLQGSAGARLPSTRASATPSICSSACAMAHSVACRMLSRSMRSHIADADADAGRCQDGLEQRLALRLRQLFRIIESRRNAVGVQHHGGGNHRPRPGPAPCFVDAAHQPRMPFRMASSSMVKSGSNPPIRPLWARGQRSVNCSPGCGGRRKWRSRA